MITYPINFEAQTFSASGINGAWDASSGEMKVSVAVPPEFEGQGGGLSPEDLFNLALSNCFVATFKVYCEKSKVTFEKLEVQSRLSVDLDDQNGKPVMKSFFLSARIHGPSNSQRILMLANKAAQSGFILNSVKTACHFEVTVAES